MSEKPKSKRQVKREDVTTIEEAAVILQEHGRVATLQDLIPSVETEKWIHVENPNNPKEEIALEIKKLDMSDLSAIGKYAKEDPNDTMIATIKYGVTQPKLSTPGVKAMGPSTCMAICKEIMEFSDLRVEDIEKAKN